jgi:hypothetical protein
MKRIPNRALQGAALSLLLAAGFLAPAAAQAQRSVRMGAAPIAPVHRAPVGGPVRPTNGRGSSGGFFPGSSFAGGPQVLAPGFTSNFPLLGNGQDLGIEAAINPATQLRLAFAERFLRDRRGLLGGGAFYLLDGGGAYVIPSDSELPQEQSQAQPQVIVLQQAPSQQQAQPALNSDPSSAPIPDVGQFTLVLHGGKKIQAVAFTRAKDNIVYIDQDGGRHTLNLADLDTAATARVNEELGTPLQLPL